MSSGYVAESENENIMNGIKTQPRFEFHDVYFGESFGEKLNLNTSIQHDCNDDETVTVN